jgi:pimeloyl-ACP methyl ester carboxylesterase
VSWYSVEGVELAFRDLHPEQRDHSDRNAVVLIHGLGGSPDDWSAQIPALEGVRAILPDLRGFARSSDAPGPYSMERFAEDVVALLDELELPAVDLVGHSMGGAIALQIALDHPGRVRRLMLVNSLADFRLHGIGRWVEYLLRRIIIALLGRGVLAALLRRRNYPRADQLAIREQLASRPMSGRTEVYVQAMRNLIRWSVSDRLASISAPTTVVTGELDLTPVSEKAELAERIPDARLEVVAGSRHGTPIGAAREFNELLTRFLEGSSSSEEDLTR